MADVPITYSVYVGKSNEDLAEWIEEKVDDQEFSSVAHLFRKAALDMKNNDLEQID